MRLEATIECEQAAREPWDVIVVGAGPAGTIAAHQAARHGLRTLLVERKTFPRDKVCGACINGRALAALHQLGLGELPTRLGAIPLWRFQLRCGRRQCNIPLPAGIALSRSEFDVELARAAIEQGAAFLPDTSARLLDEETGSDTRAVELSRSGQLMTAMAGIVLLADGLGNSSLSRNDQLRSRAASRSRIGLGGLIADCPDEFEAGTIYMAVGDVGYVGMVRVEDGRLNVAAALDPAAIHHQQPPSSAVASILRSALLGNLPQFGAAEWTGTIPLTRRSQTPAGHRVLLLGDAAGYVEPFTGEGIACALSSGAAAADFAARHVAGWSSDAERQWGAEHRLVFDKPSRWCRRLARLFWHPWAVRGVVSALAVAPWLAGPVVSHLNRAGGRLRCATSEDSARSDLTRNDSTSWRLEATTTMNAE